MAQVLGIDDWLLTTSTAVRTVTGAWSDDVDLFGEWSAPIVAVGSAVMSPAVPPSDARLIDQVADLLPRTGTLASIKRDAVTVGGAGATTTVYQYTITINWQEHDTNMSQQWVAIL